MQPTAAVVDSLPTRGRCRFTLQSSMIAGVGTDGAQIVRIADYDCLRKSSTNISALRGETSARLSPEAVWIAPERHPSNATGLM